MVCLATSATSRSKSGTVFEDICVQPSTLSTTMTTVITGSLLWLTTVPLILRRSPIVFCAVVGCIMPRFACCLWPTITHCMRVSIMCSLVSVYLHSRAKMRIVFMYASTLSSIVLFHRSQFESNNSKVLFGATYFPNRSQYTDNVFYSMSDKSQMLDTSMPSSPDHKSKYFTLTASVFFGKRTIKHELANCFEFLKCLRHIGGRPLHCRRGQPSHFCHDCDTVTVVMYA